MSLYYLLATLRAAGENFRVFTRFLSIFLKEIDVLKAKTLKIFASGGSFLKAKKLTKSTIYQSQKGAKQGETQRGGTLGIPLIVGQHGTSS